MEDLGNWIMENSHIAIRFLKTDSIYRHVYFDLLELVYGEVEKRFTQTDFRIMPINKSS